MFQVYNNEEIQNLKSQNKQFSDALNAISEDYTLTLRKISHEFGNVLTLINSSLQIIESSHPEVKTFKYWNTAMDDITYLKHLVTEISIFNNSENLHLAPVNLLSIAQTTIDSFLTMPDVLAKNIQISLSCSTNIPDIMGDYIKLKEVLINLIKNAVEACDVDGQVIVSLGTEQKHIIVTITDSGCGINPDKLEQIFLPMVTYNKIGGTGLGLPISRKIIQAHNGTISVTSTPKNGSSFTISLPL